MTSQNSDIQRLLGEKEQLKKEEDVLRSMMEKVKKQLNAVQVEQLQISNKLPLNKSYTPISEPLETNTDAPLNTGTAIPEINLDLLGPMTMTMTSVGDVEEEEEED